MLGDRSEELSSPGDDFGRADLDPSVGVVDDEDGNSARAVNKADCVVKGLNALLRRGFFGWAFGPRVLGTVRALAPVFPRLPTNETGNDGGSLDGRNDNLQGDRTRAPEVEQTIRTRQVD